MNKTNTIFKLLFPALLIMSGGSLEAQLLTWVPDDPGLHGELGSQDRRSRHFKGRQRHMRVEFKREHLSTARMWMLTNELDLTEAQAAKLFPRMRNHREEMEKLQEKRQKLVKDFLKKAADDKASAKVTERFVDDVTKLEKQRLDMKAAYLKGMKDVLKPGQMAEFAVFEERSRTRIRERFMGSGVFFEFGDDDD